MSKRITKLIKPSTWVKRAHPTPPPLSAEVSAVLEKIDTQNLLASNLANENARLRRALKECWRASKTDECADRVTAIVITALSDPPNKNQD
jgi:hypothetical protein